MSVVSIDITQHTTHTHLVWLLCDSRCPLSGTKKRQHNQSRPAHPEARKGSSFCARRGALSVLSAGVCARGVWGGRPNHARALPPQIFLLKQRAFSSPSIPRAVSLPLRCALSSSRWLLINAKRLMRCMCTQCLETSMILI